MEARHWLWAAVQADPRAAEAWLLLAATASPRASLHYVQRALESTPHDPVARAALDWAQARLNKWPAAPSLLPARPADAPAGPAVAPRPRPVRFQIGRPRPNWPLALGLAIVATLFAIALLGPRLAPRDPLEENYIAQLGSTFVKPPFPPLRVTGFPLGSDEVGRDVLSQLLWAVRPTLTLVLVAAALRLSAGTAVGLAAGWAEGRLGRAWNAAISAALAVPVLFAALCVLALGGGRWGVWAFIAGLAITGWAESARLVREQARLVKTQPFIEAARALGASDRELLGRHVLPQILPLTWMLLAQEISGALLTTAGLGFLGYFVYSIWIPVGDFVGLRTTGRPELGQMLGSAAQVQAQPWNMLASGAVIFVAVLGFNLLGEGLQEALSLETARRRRSSRLGQTLEAAAGWAGDRLFDPLSPWRRGLQMAAAAGVVLFILVGGGFALLRVQNGASPAAALAVPGGHAWASSQHDAQGTLWLNALGPVAPRVLYRFEAGAGLLAGPAVAADGTAYVASAGTGITALGPDGALLWQSALVEPPAGAPALGPDGTVYVAGTEGSLTAVASDGGLRWRVEGGARRAALAGPIVGPDGTVFFATELNLLAVAPEGTIRWETGLPTFSYASPVPRLGPDARFLFFEDIVVDARTGATLYGESPEPLDKFSVGADGRIYRLSQESLAEFIPAEGSAQLVEKARWDPRALNLGFRYPQDGGVTPSRRIWLFFSSGFDFGMAAWLDAAGQPLPPVNYPYRGAVRLVGIDQADTMYVCGPLAQTPPNGECRANRPGETAPLWKVELEVGATPVGGALAPGRLYVALGEGWLVALGD